jgi:hypothetical protein
MFVKDFTHNCDGMSPLLSVMNHRTTTARQVHQSGHGTFRPTFKESLTLIQHCLLTATQDGRCCSDGLASIG